MTAPQRGPTEPVRFGDSSGRRGPSGFGLTGALVGLAIVVAVIGGLAWSTARESTSHARHPEVFGGSLVLDDYRPLTVVDVADAAVTVRLQGVYAQVSADSYSNIQAVPVDEGTMLINRRTGTFNLLGNDDYVVDASGAGIGLGPLAGTTGAEGMADGADAYILRFGSHATVSLVDAATVTQGAKTESDLTESAGSGSPAGARTASPKAATVTPRGFAALGGPVAERPGVAVVAAGDLWSLVDNGRGCRIVRSEPVARGHDGLLDHVEGQTGTVCSRAVLESTGGVVGLATPGHVRLFLPGQTGSSGATSSGGVAAASPAPAFDGRDIAVPGTAKASELVPVTGTKGQLWFLARLPGGWSVFGVTSAGVVSAPHALAGTGKEGDGTRVAPGAELATPVESAGQLYTLTRTGTGQPALLSISPLTGSVATVAGAGRYPAKTADEKASFAGAEMLVDGPRVIYNNPDSLLAVVVFTDHSHAPVVVDKSTAVDVSAVGPGDIDAKASPKKAKPKGRASPTTPPTTAPSKPATVPQPVNQQVTCANTTQTPYSPQITSIAPSSGSALISWSYQLLDEQDCEPDSWSVQVTALDGADQPTQPVQIVDGQNQLQFTGLRPATSYKAVVTAYINHQSTPSAPGNFATSARGPDAPTSVKTTADGNGNWIVSWKPCTAATCYVPADSWAITGTSCASAYVGQPPSAQVSGGQTSVTIPAGSQIGTSLSFSVQGSLADGLTGPPTADGTCTEAWQAPNSADITLSATGTAAGSTITANLAVANTQSPAEAFGSSATDFTYSVGGVIVGPTTETTVSVPNLPAGATYTPTVLVAPVGHPTASVTITAAPFSQTVPWPPGLSVQASVAVDSDPNSGSVTASFTNLPSATLSATGGITCGSVELAMNGSLTNGQLTVNNLDLDSMGGSCSLLLTLDDTDTPDPFGAPSPTLSTTFNLGTQPAYSFSATVDPACATYCDQDATEADVTFPGGGQPAAGVNWTVTTTGACSDVAPVSSSTPSFPYQINLSNCADPQGAAFKVSWEYLGTTQNSPIEPLSGTFGTTTTTTTTTTTVPPTTVPIVAPTTPVVPTTPAVPTTPPTTPTTPPTTPTTAATTTTTVKPTTTSTTVKPTTTTTCVAATTTTSTTAKAAVATTAKAATTTKAPPTTVKATTTTSICHATAAAATAAAAATGSATAGAADQALVSGAGGVSPPGDDAGGQVIDVALALMAAGLGTLLLRGARQRARGPRRRGQRGQGRNSERGSA